MSDRNPNPEDRAIEQAWDQVMRGGSEPRLSAVGNAAESELVREYTELLGLLPYELEIETPPAHIKEAVLARAAGGYGAGAPAAGGAEASEAMEAAPIVPFERPAARRESPVQRPIWRYAQAAMLAASLVGLGFLSATVWQQKQQIVGLRSELAAAALERSEILQVRQEMQTTQSRLKTTESRLNMITSVARKAYPLRTVSTNDSVQRPEGIVYVCGMHQQWYLNLHGLEPPAEGGEYHLWFMTDEGKVDGGILEVHSDTSLEMESQSMPDGTHGFLVTLEQQDEAESLTILLGESPINL